MAKKKKTLAQYTKENYKALAGSPTKRGRGRPKGSKNKSKEMYGPVYDPKLAGRRRRGRPKGSKNKVNVILTPLKGSKKHHIKLEGNVIID